MLEIGEDRLKDIFKKIASRNFQAVNQTMKQNTISNSKITFNIGYNHEEDYRASPAPKFSNKFVLTNSVITTKTILTTYFTGREIEINKIQQHIDKGDKIYITGMGGIGKITLCKYIFDKYIHKYKDNEIINIEHIGYFIYDVSLEKTIYNCLDFDKSNDYNFDISMAWNYIYKLCSEKKVLLFIDNVTNYDIDKLNNLNCAVVITTRYNAFYEFKEFKLGRLSKTECIDIFTKIIGSYIDEKEALEYIILNMANCHTLTITLLAYLIRSKGWSISKLKQELLIKKFQIAFKHKGVETNIHNQLEILFDISSLSDSEINVLEGFSIFPYNKKISIEECHSWLDFDACSSKDDDIYKNLHDKGWLELDETYYSIHPVIAEMIKGKNTILYKNHIGLVKAYAIDLSNKNLYYETIEYASIGENILNYIYDENDFIVSIMFHLANFYNAYAKYSMALQLYESILNIRKKCLGTEHIDVAILYSKMAFVYSTIGDYENALNLYFNALAIFERFFDNNYPDIARIYNNMARVYDRLTRYSKALELYDKALNIYNTFFVEEHPEIATTYNDIAGVYYSMKNYTRALEFYGKDLIIRKKILDKNHPDLATTYNNMARAYNRIGNYDIALELYENALNIRENVLGKNQPQTAKTYNNMGEVYKNIGQYQKALDFYNKALIIRKSIFGECHLDTASTYNNMAILHCAMGEYLKALELYKKSLIIMENILGSNNPSTLAISNKILELCNTVMDSN